MHQKRRDLWHKAVKGNPRIFLTLTLKPDPASTPDLHAAALVRHFRMLRQYLMRRLKRRSPTFLAVVEAHESGWPHLHILLRSGFIHHRLIREWWERQTGSWQIDIRLAKGKRQVASYVSKYISKNPARFEHVKRFWCSQDWDPKRSKDGVPVEDEFTWWETSALHPLGIARCAIGDGAHVRAEGHRWIIEGWTLDRRQRWGFT